MIDVLTTDQSVADALEKSLTSYGGAYIQVKRVDAQQLLDEYRHLIDEITELRNTVRQGQGS